MYVLNPTAGVDMIHPNKYLFLTLGFNLMNVLTRKPLNLVPAFDGVQFVRGIGCIRALILLEISRCSSDNETKTEEALLFRIAEFHLL